MSKNSVSFLIILSTLLILMRMANSLECYRCESLDGSNKDCDNGQTNMTKFTCTSGSDKACFKAVGKGKNSQDKKLVIRGCIAETEKSKSYPEGSPFSYPSSSGGDPYNLIGTVYTCESSLCNSSNNLKHPFVLMASLFGFSMFFSYKSRFISF